MIYRNINKRRGFALLVTIVLVAFLVLILVGLATFTRVETQVAANAQNIAAARQNALTALNIAVGQLQRYAGPDQRVTAPADIKGDASGNRDTAIRNPFYTGVWNAAPTDAVLPPALNPSTPLAWLVSGSETTTAPLATTDYSASGELLVGPNSTSNATQYVYAPRVALTSSNVPGLPAGNTTIGRYAYWVGDEGVKARLNLTDKLAPRAAATGGSPAAFSPSATQESLRLSAAQRMGVERMPGLGAIAGIHNNTTAGADTAALLSRTLTPNQLPFVDSTITAARPRELFHDVSTVSNSVLSDTVNGGLRADLTYLFEQSSPANFRTEMNRVITGANAIGAAGQANPADTQIVPKIVGSNAKYTWAQGPTWYQLRSFYLLGRGTGSEGAVDGSGNYVPRPHRADVHGLYPIITQFRMKFGIQARLTAPDTYRMEGVFAPLIVLANPYNVRLAAQDLLFNVDFNGGTPFFMKGVNQPNTPNAGTGGWASANIAPIYFKIQGVAFEPGEARVFTLSDGDPAEGWNSALGCYDYNPTVTRRFPMENDLNLDDRRIAVITGSTTATTTELSTGLPATVAAVNQNYAGFSGEIRMRLFTDTGALTTPVASQLLQRLEWSLRGVGTVGNGAVNIGLIQSTTPGSNLLTWAPATDSFALIMASPLTSPSINMYQSVNLRAPLRARFNTAAAGGTIVNSGYNAENPVRRDSYMVILSDFKRAVWGMRNQGSGAQFNSSAAGGGAPAALEKAILYDAPSTTSPIVSLGQLQHFNPAGFPNPATTSPSDEISRSQSHGPAFAIGNARASLYVTRNAYDEVNGNAAGARLLKDTSFLLNRALWDSFYFSTVPQSGTFDFNGTDLLANPRLSPFRPEIASSAIASYRSGPFDASRNLLLSGGFNINSTSFEAWRALFSSLNQIPYPGTATALTGAYARSLKQTGGIADSTSGDNGLTVGAWSGYRNLTTVQIDALATEMVKQVRLRGPFAGLADFVNRRVEAGPKGLTGALQAAIEATESLAATSRLNNKTDGTASNALYFNAPAGADATRIKDAAHHETMQVSGIPGIIRQADLLQALGPVLTARSDTFVVRTYGEVVNPATSVTEGRAWLEAVVQRLPDFVDTANDAATLQSALNATNTSFGRRFRVVSFRWLSPDDI